MNFHGAKIALLFDNKILMHLRDNTPGLFNANMWDFAGGGREGDESPYECAIREVQEEFGITLTNQSFVWGKEYPAQKDPAQKAWFMVASIEQKDLDSIILAEGQRWELLCETDFFQRADVIEALKIRYRDYLDTKGNINLL